MERNSESRNRYGNDRYRRDTDQNSNWNQSYEDRPQKNRNWTSDENQPGNGYNNEDRSSRERGYGDSSYGRSYENRFDRTGDRRNRNDQRLESMGPLGNSSQINEDDYRDARNQNFGQWNQSNDYNRNNGSAGTGQGWNRPGNQSYERSDNSRNWWEKTKDEVAGWFGDENAQQRRNYDQQTEHRGKGPKGYVRSDERIKEDVNERLTEDGSIDAGEIEVDVNNGEVFLKGTVNSRQEKRRAEDIIEQLSGVKNVENHLKVVDRNQGTGNAGQYTNGRAEKKRGLEYGPNAVSGMSNSSSTGDFNTAR